MSRASGVKLLNDESIPQGPSPSPMNAAGRARRRDGRFDSRSARARPTCLRGGVFHLGVQAKRALRSRATRHRSSAASTPVDRRGHERATAPRARDLRRRSRARKVARGTLPRQSVRVRPRARALCWVTTCQLDARDLRAVVRSGADATRFVHCSQLALRPRRSRRLHEEIGA